MQSTRDICSFSTDYKFWNVRAQRRCWVTLYYKICDSASQNDDDIIIPRRGYTARGRRPSPAELRTVRLKNRSLDTPLRKHGARVTILLFSF